MDHKPSVENGDRHHAADVTALRAAAGAKTTKSAGTRRRLLDVAAELFVERGFAGVSMSDIATASELTKGAVYGDFRSKGQLLVEVIRWKIAEADHTPEFGAATVDP